MSYERAAGRQMTDPALMRLVIDNNPFMGILFDDRYNVIGCNREAVRFFGFRDEEEFRAGFIELILASIPTYQPSGKKSVPLGERFKATLEEGVHRFESELIIRGESKQFDIILRRERYKGKYVIYGHMAERVIGGEVSNIHILEKAKYESIFLSRLFQAVNAVAEELVAATPETIGEAIGVSLKMLGEAAEADRTYIWELYDKEGATYARQIYEWSESVEPQQGKEFTLAYNLEDSPFWKSRILGGTIFNGPVKSIPEGPEREVVEQQGIRSMVLIPIQMRGRVWGYIGFDDCKMERIFTKPEEQVLVSGGVLMISAIIANTVTQQLMIQGNLRRAVSQLSLYLMEKKREEIIGSRIREALKVLSESTGADIVSVWRCIDERRVRSFSIYATNEPEASGEYEIELGEYLPEWSGSQLIDINKRREELSAKLRDSNLMRKCKSLLLLPIRVQEQFWGFIGFEHRRELYNYTEAERDILRSSGMMLASSIIRDEINESLEEARRSAEASARAKSEFLSRMSHEIRTPINAIIGMTELFKRGADGERAEHYIEVIDTSSRQLLGIINDVLDMSKIDANKLEIVKSEFDLESMLWHVVDVIRVKLDEKELSFRLEIEEELKRKVISDKLRLSQVLTNLLSNAVKFTPRYGAIELRVKMSAKALGSARLRIEVKDSGIGIRQEDLEKIFQAFAQADVSSTREYGGTGLGLAICRQLVSLMGGRIWAESGRGAECNSGASFIVELDIEWGTELDAAGAEEKSDEAAEDFSGETILLADDVEINREIVSGILEETGIGIDYAENGAQALDMFRASPERYGLIFMDVQMPVLDGIAATREIRRSGVARAGEIPIIAMTANAFKEDVEAVLEAGMNGHLAKPIDVAELMKALKGALKKR